MDQSLANKEFSHSSITHRPAVRVIGCQQRPVLKSSPPTPGLGLPGLQQLMTPGVGWGHKFLWFSVFILCSTICCYQLVDRINTYISEPTSVNVLIFRNESITFPSFTICLNITSFMTAMAESFKDVMKQSCNSVQNKNMCIPENIDFVDFNAYGVTVYQLWESVRFNQSALRVIKKEKTPASYKGTESILQGTLSYLNTAVGYCLTYTIEQPLTLNGRTSVTFKIDEDSFAPQLSEKNFSATYYYGFHEADKNQVHEIVGYSEIFQVGKWTSTRMTIKEYAYVNKKRKPCADKDQIHQLQVNCLIEYFRSETLPCRLPFNDTHSANFKDACKNINTTEETLRTMFNLYDKPEVMRCYQKLDFCRETIYNFQTLLQTPAGTPGLASLEVFILDEVFETIQESFTYNLNALWSDIGGSLGFFLGFSIITIFEALDQCVLRLRKLV